MMPQVGWSLADHGDTTETVTNFVDGTHVVTPIVDLVEREMHSVWSCEDTAALVQFGKFVVGALLIGTGHQEYRYQPQHDSHHPIVTTEVPRR